MPFVTRFDTPGSLRDAPDGSPFYDDWHAYVAGLTARVTPGSGGGEFFDPSEADFLPAAKRALVWMGFPRDLMVTTHRDSRAAAFAAGEVRAVQEEYLEWHVTRSRGKITKVVFVTETPDYWRALAVRHPDVVLRLYRELVSPSVTMADLFPGGGPYDPGNQWNTTRGIVHFVQSINRLDAAIGLAQNSVNSAPALDNYDVPPGDQTSADPRVQLDVGTLARKGLSLTLAEPIGLYILGWDTTGWSKPDGSPVGDYWTIRRGVPGAALRVELAVPKSEGFVLGDIRIGGRPIRTGGEIAEHVTVMALGIAGKRRG
ncbi:MAG TPA: hypothetical protein VEV43_06365 [Actinomycetota bacterium]|nr:hypothetical protein [Actinomycetota bacterium]